MAKLNKIAKEAVVQGGHKYRITHFFVSLVKAAREEFTEDNEVTLNCFLRECFEDALREST